ncbi:uncharacterized protein [Porites lutea]|uniref:uncharacterized protein n=1 Tax=Porites lutea TaxID=51062 RepID=UPI003CC5874A
MFQNIFLLNLMFGVSNLYFKVLGFHSLTVNNYVLVGSVYQVIHVDDWFGCILSCHDDLPCISYNYNTSSRLCELNYCSGLQDLCDRDNLLIYSTGCVFQKIRDCENDRSSSNTSRIQESGKSAPAGFPQNVREINKTSRSILIAWDAVLTNSSKQQNYKVAYIRFKRITGAAIKTIQVYTVYANLTGLLHNTRYNITVLAYNEYGDGPSSELVVLKTDQGSKISSLCLLF